MSRKPVVSVVLFLLLPSFSSVSFVHCLPVIEEIDVVISQVETDGYTQVTVRLTVLDNPDNVSNIILFIDETSKFLMQGTVNKSLWITEIYLVNGTYYFAFLISFINGISTYHDFGPVVVNGQGKQSTTTSGTNVFSLNRRINDYLLKFVLVALITSVIAVFHSYKNITASTVTNNVKNDMDDSINIQESDLFSQEFS